MIILNFSHPILETELPRIGELTGQEIDRVMDIKTHFDNEIDFGAQVRDLVEGIGLSATEWQTAPLLIAPPSFNVITAVLLAELHGRMGYFPPVLRLKPVPDVTPPRFVVAEVINLQAVRDAARAAR